MGEGSVIAPGQVDGVREEHARRDIRGEPTLGIGAGQRLIEVDGQAHAHAGERPAARCFLDDPLDEPRPLERDRDLGRRAGPDRHPVGPLAAPGEFPAILDRDGERPRGDLGDREPALVVGDGRGEAAELPHVARRVGIGADPHREPADRPRIAGLDPPGDPADGHQPERPDSGRVRSGHAELLHAERARHDANDLDLIDRTNLERRPAPAVGPGREPIAQVVGEVHATDPRRGQPGLRDGPFVRVEHEELDRPGGASASRMGMPSGGQSSGIGRIARAPRGPIAQRKTGRRLGSWRTSPRSGSSTRNRPSASARRVASTAGCCGTAPRFWANGISDDASSAKHDLHPDGRLAVGADHRPGQDDPLPGRLGRLGQQHQDHR